MLSGGVCVREQVDEGPMDVVKMMKLLGPLEEELVRLMRKIGTKPSAAAGTHPPSSPPVHQPKPTLQAQSWPRGLPSWLLCSALLSLSSSVRVAF